MAPLCFHKIPLVIALSCIGLLALSQPHASGEAAQASSNSGEITDDSTPADIFAAMKKNFQAQAAKGVHAAYQFEIRGPEGGLWWIIVNDGDFTMGRGVTKRPDVVLKSTDKDWVKLSTGSLGGIRAYLTGRLKVTGSQSLARKLDEMFP
jgi:putative sterol carrier protein